MYRRLFNFGLFTLLSMSISTLPLAALITPNANINGLDLRWSQTESNAVQAFNEAQDIFITENSVKVDYLLGHNLNLGQKFKGVSHSRSNLFLKEGIYSSHLLHFDPTLNKSGNVKNQRFEFTDNIVAIILGGEYLNLSDYIFGDISTQYEQSISRRMEKGDTFSLESNNILLVDKIAVGRYWIDDARIITQKVPEPGAWAIFGIGLLCLVGTRKLLKT